MKYGTANGYYSEKIGDDLGKIKGTVMGNDSITVYPKNEANL